MQLKLCFLGGARYSQPLDPTSVKKFRALATLAETFVIGFSQDLRPRRFDEHARFYLLPKWPLPILRYLTMFTLGPLLVLWLILRHGARIVVAQSPYEGFAAALAKAIVQRLGRRVVLVVESHGDFEVSLFLQRRVLAPWLYRFLMKCAARFALRHAELLRAISNSTRAQLEKWAPGKPILQFPAWTDIEAFLEAGAVEVKRRYEILYAGVLIPRKGVHHLINAFARIAPEFPQARLVIIGREENEAYASQLKTRVAELGLNGRVEFGGEIPQVELARRMRRAAAFVLPSLSEGLGRVVVEAMATGTPVIGSRVGGIPEMVEDGVSGFLCPPGDEAALAGRLHWVLAHSEEAEAVGRRAREFAGQFFSAEGYLRGYREVLAAASGILEQGGSVHAPTAV